MTEDDARRLLLVRAIEREDRHGDLLTHEDRQQADASGRGGRGGESGRGGEGGSGGAEDFLARRAEFAAARLSTRHPAVGLALRRARWPGWAGWAVPLIAMVIGMIVNELGNGRRLDLLAVPLLGTFAWNLAVYVGLAVALVIPNGHKPSPLHALLAGHVRPLKEAQSPIARALARFGVDWGRASAPLVAARLARTMHLSAAMFALGLVISIYFRALSVEYRAGWESTFLGPNQVHAILATLLGPASTVTGMAIPDAAAIAALRWTGPFSGGENAGRWIHLYTATTIGFIVIPRLLLAAWQAVRAGRLARHFPVPGREDFYIRRLLRGADGLPGAVRVTPYAFRPEAATRARIEALLREALGDGARVHFDDPVEYGAEEGWIASAGLRPDDDHHVLLFTLSATPEEENHGEFARLLRERLPAGAVASALLDESAFRRHFAGQAGLDARIDTRRRAWGAVLAGAGVSPVSLDLSSTDGDDVQRLEAVLGDAGMEHAR